MLKQYVEIIETDQDFSSPIAGLGLKVLERLLGLGVALLVNDGVHHHAGLGLVCRDDVLYLETRILKTPATRITCHRPPSRC